METPRLLPTHWGRTQASSLCPCGPILACEFQRPHWGLWERDQVQDRRPGCSAGGSTLWAQQAGPAGTEGAEGRARVRPRGCGLQGPTPASKW